MARAQAAAAPGIVLASYNTHGAVGIDRRFRPERIADVIAEIGADVVALQELDSRKTGIDVLEILRERSGFTAIAGPTFTHGKGDFGNGLLTRYPVRSVDRVKLDVGRREPRGALDVVLETPRGPLRVIATHLGLSPSERRDQVTRLLEVVRRGAAHPTVLVGDLNEWFLRGTALRWLHAHFGESPARATFPSFAPALALDRVWVTPAQALRVVRVHRSGLARVASDHLPLVAEISL